jgi:DNA topoisomerase VI subunit B
MTFRYRTISGEAANGIPFVVEAAFAAAPDSDQPRRLVLGVNFAAALGNPFRTFSHSYEGLESRLADQRCGTDEPVVVILHLAQARVEYQDRGKSAVVLARAISRAIVTALEAVTGKWAKQRKAEERDYSRRARRRDQLIGKPERVTAKQAASAVMRDAYLKASDNGQLPAKPRQIMYAARPKILEMTGKDAHFAAFCRNLDAHFPIRALPIDLWLEFEGMAEQFGAPRPWLRSFPD